MASKEQLLMLLRSGGDTWVSGEGLAERLGISRAAVCKQVASLRREGYELEASTKKGYRLLHGTRQLIPREIQQDLRTRIVGKGEIEHWIEVESTNARAQALAAVGAAEGTLVVAEGQTLGRGRRGRAWHSPTGAGIYASLVLRPSLAPEHGAKLNFVAAIAAAEAIVREAGVHARLKWPNDVMVGGRKIAGILTLMVADIDAIQYAIVGLGVNVNGAKESFPAELRGNATTLRIESGREWDRTQLLRAWLESFELWYDRLLGAEAGCVLGRWRELSDTVGSLVRVQMLEDTCTGTAVGVDDAGCLLVEQSSGDLRRIVAGDVELLGGASGGG